MSVHGSNSVNHRIFTEPDVFISTRFLPLVARVEISAIMLGIHPPSLILPLMRSGDFPSALPHSDVVQRSTVVFDLVGVFKLLEDPSDREGARVFEIVEGAVAFRHCCYTRLRGDATRDREGACQFGQARATNQDIQCASMLDQLRTKTPGSHRLVRSSRSCPYRPNRTATAGGILFTIGKTHTSPPTNLLKSFSTLLISTSITGDGTLNVTLPYPAHLSMILACV